MIRVLAYALAVALGLAAALIAQGRMYHLRLALPAALPAWTDRIAADASLTAGTMRLIGTGSTSTLDLGWKAQIFGSDGWHWALRLTGPGADLRARMTMPFDLTRARIDDAAGAVDLAKLGPVARDLGGIIELTGLNLSVQDIRKNPRASGTAQANWRGATFQNTALGDGTIRAELDPLQSWRAWIDVKGGVAEVQATLSGRLPRPVVALKARISDDPALPRSWRRALVLTGEKKQDAWEVRQTVTLRPTGG